MEVPIPLLTARRCLQPAEAAKGPEALAKLNVAAAEKAVEASKAKAKATVETATKALAAAKKQVKDVQKQKSSAKKVEAVAGVETAKKDSKAAEGFKKEAENSQGKLQALKANSLVQILLTLSTLVWVLVLVCVKKTLNCVTA